MEESILMGNEISLISNIWDNSPIIFRDLTSIRLH